MNEYITYQAIDFIVGCAMIAVGLILSGITYGIIVVVVRHQWKRRHKK